MSNLEETNKKTVSWSQIMTIALVAVILLWIGLRIFFSDVPTIFAASPPQNIGVQQGQLTPCPITPNCVSSQETDVEHYIEPLVTQGESIAKLKELISQQPRTRIITASDNYLYAQFTSQWLGFVDDVEFYLNPSQPDVIEVRSASRLGESDLGVNRQRIETLRQLLNNENLVSRG